MLHNHCHKMSQQGLTLIELLVTLSVLAIVLSQGIPSLQSLLQKQQVSTYTNQLFLALTLARSEAVKRGQNITLCASSSGHTCTSQQINWNTGWLITTDDNTLLHSVTLNDPSFNLFWNRKNSLRFNAQGQSPGFNGTFTLCHRNNELLQKTVILSNTGRARVETPSTITVCTS